MRNLLKEIYGEKMNEETILAFEELAKGSVNKHDQMSHKNAYVITYGDTISSDKTGIETVSGFLDSHYENKISDIHILPMYPYTSDDGFSVVDFLEIDSRVGTWESIGKVSGKYRLMYDFVANHISQESEWFKEYLKGNEKYQEYFTEKEEGFDYSNVTRPRALPLFYQYENGKEVWATFSKDQVDINFKSPLVLLELTKILVEYINRGATSIRLDAIGFIWKESGTTCIHLDNAHKIIKVWRKLIDQIAPNVQIITETNVPHLENISYYGNGSDEAHQVYQFTLPPLTLFTFLNGDSTKFNEWAKTIKLPSDSATFFNFLASHDGIGMRPVEGILSNDEIQSLVDHTQANGGLLGLKNLPDGTTSVYELNCCYFDAIKDKNVSEEMNISRFLAAHFILISVVGVPAIYINSLLGSTNYYEGVEESGINRRINRQKYELDALVKDIENSEFRTRIINELNALLSARTTNSDFNPYVDQEIVDMNSSVICIKRQNTTALVNVTNAEVEVPVNGVDIITNKEFNGKLAPYQYVWVK